MRKFTGTSYATKKAYANADGRLDRVFQFLSNKTAEITKLTKFTEATKKNIFLLLFFVLFDVFVAFVIISNPRTDRPYGVVAGGVRPT
jgi:hypothetical protein